MSTEMAVVTVARAVVAEWTAKVVSRWHSRDTTWSMIEAPG